MDQLRAAAPLARALLALGLARKSGVLRVRALGRVAFLWLEEGKVVRLDGVDGPLLGDALLEVGALDVSRHREAWTEQPPAGPVGQWLVESGVVPAAAVAQALATQLARRLYVLLTWPAPSLVFSAALRRQSDPLLCVELSTLVWQGLKRLADGLCAAEQAALSCVGPLSLTAYGARLVRTVLRGSFDPQWLAADSSARCERALLRTLGAAVPVQQKPEGYSLLLRKRRQLEKRAAPWALLDLPARPRPEQARRALRQLAGRLHPDRFAGAAPELRALSGEVLRALVHAELTLRVAR